MAQSDKPALRKEAVSRRDAIEADLREAKNAGIRRRVSGSAEFVDAKCILMYASFGSEVDTFGIMENALGSGKRVALPRVVKDTLDLEIYEIKATGELSAGYMGIPEPQPSEERRVSLNDIDLVLIPGVAFDVQRHRLGYGKGCYDRLLSDAAGRLKLFALAFEEQIFENIPSEPHDVRMDRIITDKRTI